MSAGGRALPRGRGRRTGLSAAEARAALTSRTFLETSGVIIGFLVLAIVVTWPVLLHAGTIITGGGYGGDQTGYIWDYWYLDHFDLKLWGAGVQEIVSAPFGREYAGGINATILTSLVPAWIAVKVAGPVVAYNVVVISGLTLSSAAMYWLVRWLGLGVGASIWAGVAFMIWPYAQIRASGHLTLVHMECLPIVLLAGIRWIERPGWGRAFVLAGALGFSWLSNPYYGLMASVMVAVVLIAGTIRALRRGGARAGAARLGEAAAACTALVIIPLALLLASSREAVDATVERSRNELELYGARITDFVLPPMAGLWSDLQGAFSWANPGGERLNFVGWTTIILAIAALILGWRWRERLSARQGLLLVVGVPMVLVCMWFSLATPTRWFGAEISMPSDLVFDSLPYLRVYARFVVPVMVTLLAMGALGLWLLMRGRSTNARLSILSVALILTVIDLAPTLPLRSAEPLPLVGLTTPDRVPTWAWLKANERGAIVFETPGTPNELLERYYTYGQILHGHPITNANNAPSQLGYDFQAENGNPAFPGTAGRLASVGIGLVTVEPWGYGRLGQQPPDPRRPPPGFIPVRIFADGSAIWRVAAAPDPAVAVRRDGWWATELLNGRLWRWMESEARVTVLPRRPGTFRATFRAKGYIPGGTYTIAVRSPDGFVDRVRIGREGTYAATIHAPRGRSDIRLTDEGPPARQISAIDKRIVSVQMTPWELHRLTP